MKKSKIDSIVISIGCTVEMMPDPKCAVSDNAILSILNSLDNLDEKDAMGRTLLMYAALHDRFLILQYLLAKKVDIHAKDKNLHTALHFAVQADNVRIIEALIDAGANIDEMDKYGNSPLMRCNNDTSLSTIKLLLESGANPAQENNYGVSAKDIFATRDDVMGLINRFV